MGKYRLEKCFKRAWLRRRWWFRLVHSNGQIIMTSEMYSSKQARDDSVCHLAASLGFVDIHETIEELVNKYSD